MSMSREGSDCERERTPNTATEHVRGATLTLGSSSLPVPAGACVPRADRAPSVRAGFGFGAGLKALTALCAALALPPSAVADETGLRITVVTPQDREQVA